VPISTKARRNNRKVADSPKPATSAVPRNLDLSLAYRAAIGQVRILSRYLDYKEKIFNHKENLLGSAIDVIMFQIQAFLFA
jgi:hypothetical protein